MAMLILANLAFLGCFDSGDDGGENDGDVSTDGDRLDGDEPDGDEPDGDDPSDGDGEEVVADPLPFSPAGPEATPDPFEKGPFPVGVKTYTFYDTSRKGENEGEGRRLKVDVWYPARQQYKDGPFWKLDMIAESQGEDLGDRRAELESYGFPEFDTELVRDAEPDIGNGPYPVILFSHGANGIRFQSVFYTTHLASHGYVVAAPDHLFNTLWDILRDGYSEASVIASAPDRPKDMSFLLDRLTEMNDDPENPFYRSMDLENVGITGHSFGGFTSVATPCNDERFKVSVPHSPVISMAVIFGCTLEEYPVPIMVMGGTKDNTLRYYDQYCEYGMIKGSPKYLYELVGGGHFTFSDMCRLDLETMAEEMDFGDAAHALGDGCSPTDNVPYVEAQTTINYYGTAMFNWQLRGSEGSKELLDDRDDPPFDTVNFYEGDVPDWSGPEGSCGWEE